MEHAPPAATDAPLALRGGLVGLLSVCAFGGFLMPLVAALPPVLFGTGVLVRPPWETFRVHLVMYAAIGLFGALYGALATTAAVRVWRGGGWWLALLTALIGLPMCVNWTTSLAAAVTAVVLLLPETRTRLRG
jgi:hypothetical protein